ncbi:MAG: glutathione S-transferase family protein [Pelagimonas sp.]|jgi:putative glutathione S-transferase|nr:glutathione S-transferase family protein [Pelagimonas sp.]
MGLLVDGAWRTDWYDTKGNGGAFVRSTAGFRNWITHDGTPGPSGQGGFKAEAGRYHLYVSMACPWAHRTLIFRQLKELDDLIDISVVSPDMLDEGWSFATDFPGSTGDRLFGLPYLRDIYTRAVPDVSGRVSVPVLWDKQQNTIVSNESAEIIRMFNSAFDALTGNELDFWPVMMREEIEQMNTRIYDTVNNGVYRAGFATSQSAYDAAIGPLFETLDWLEQHLSDNRYLLGERQTEADWRLFPTLIRFDTVYHGHFKCNIKRLSDYPNLWAYTRALYQQPCISRTVDLKQAKRHYYFSHDRINPTRVVPAGPDLDLWAPHGR